MRALLTMRSVSDLTLALQSGWARRLSAALCGAQESAGGRAGDAARVVAAITVCSPSMQSGSCAFGATTLLLRRWRSMSA